MNKHSQTVINLGHSFLITCLAILVVKVGRKLEAATEALSAHSILVVPPIATIFERAMIVGALIQMGLLLYYIIKDTRS